MAISLEEYLKRVASHAGDSYGKAFRGRFADHRGTSELAMLASPSTEELVQLERAVAIMTANEKQNAAELEDDALVKIAEDAKIDKALLAIFINGYNLECKRVS